MIYGIIWQFYDELRDGGECRRDLVPDNSG